MVGAVAAIVLGLLLAQNARGADAPLPASMAALGDSLTTGWGSDGVASDNTNNSWATGANPAVDSHRSRIQAQVGPIAASTYAIAGRKASDLPRQAGLVASGIGYVTIAIGTNDLCEDVTSIDQMTPVGTYEGHVRSALNALFGKSPDARVLIASIPNWLHVAQSYPNEPRPSGTCPLLFEDGVANSATQAAVHQRSIEYNGALASACAEFVNCRYDGGAVFGLALGLGDLSALDAFHLSVAGQAKVAAATWDAGWYQDGGDPGPGGGGGGAGQTELSVSLAASEASITEGETVTYTAGVRTTHAAWGASGIVLTLELPSGAAGVSAQSTRGAGCIGTDPVTCDLDFLLPGQEAVVTVVVRFDAAGEFSTRVGVSSHETDVDPTNNQMTVATAVREVSRPPRNAAAVTAPKISLVRSTKKKLLRITQSTTRVVVAPAVSIDRAATVRVRILGPARNRALRLLKGSRVGATVAKKATRVIRHSTKRRMSKRRPLRVGVRLPGKRIKKGRVYRLEIRATDRSGRKSKLVVRFRLV